MLRFAFLAVLIAGALSKCPQPFQPWLHGRCLMAQPTAITFDDAEQACESTGGWLASIHSADENSKITEATSDFAYHIFLGLRCNQTTKQFQWIDGSKLDYTNFQSGPPSSCTNTQQVTFDPSGGIWTAYDNAGYNSYLCEYPNDDEYPCDQGYDYVEDADLCVQGVSHVSAWKDAENTCQELDMNAHLVSLHSNESNDAIAAYALAHGFTGGIHIGLSKQNGDLVWKDATPYDYNDFQKGMPIDAFGTCVAQRPQKLQWLSVNCESHDLLPFLCALPAFVPLTTLNPPGCPENSYYNEGGQFFSPGYPLSIETGGAVCDYFLYGDEGKRVLLYFSVFELNTCCDSLEIYDGVLAGQPTTVLTGELLPGYELESSSNILHLVLKIGDGQGVRGFNGTYRIVQTYE